MPPTVRQAKDTPLLSLTEMMASGPSPYDEDEDYTDSGEPVRRKWVSYVPLAFIVVLLLSPHPSLIIFLVHHFLLTPDIRSVPTVITHILVTYTLTFLAFSSLIVCIVRDPGRPGLPEPHEDEQQGLVEDDDYTAPGKWCRKCWAPKYERTHHCSTCGRCVLKMDHHCVWLASKCIGHRNYPAFVHFLSCVTLLSAYIAYISLSALWYSFYHPLDVDATAPIHEMIIGFEGLVFLLVIGSFLGYHLYLISTNQTTIETLNPYMILRHIPPLNTDSPRLSSPPLEHELSYDERVLVRDAHQAIRMYDRGLKANWLSVFGVRRRAGWLARAWYGGSSPGDGKRFERNARAESQLDRLARELSKLEAERQ